MVSTRLQRDVSRRSFCTLAGFAQGEHFGMRLPGTLVPALSYDLFAMRNHTTHARIRLRGIEAAFGQTQGLRHMRNVNGGEVHGNI
jgi:hypothetical protein